MLGPEPALYGSAKDMHQVVTILRGRVVMLARLFLLGIACIWMACALLPWAHNVYGSGHAAADVGNAVILTVLCLVLLCVCVLVALHDWRNFGATSDVMAATRLGMREIEEMMQRVQEHGADYR